MTLRKNKKRTAVPIYVFILLWLLCAVILPLYKLYGILIATGISLSGAALTAHFLRKREKPAADEVPKEPAKPNAAPASPYGPEVDAIIADGKLAMREMGRLYGSIPNPEIRHKINEIMAVSDKIIRDAMSDPSDVPQIRKFLDFYLPTTIKLLNAYDRMGAMEISGENITGSMQRIEDMLDTTIEAYKKQLDALFANQAADIQIDIDVMNGMLAREGLGGDSYLDIKDFMKKYQTQQKGSTANG